MSKTIEKALKEAIGGNNCKFGHKEVFQSIKWSKIIVFSSSTHGAIRRVLEQQALAAGAQIHQFGGNSMQLGKLCGKPFRVSVVAVKAE